MQHGRQGMNTRHLLIMLICCLVPIVALGAAWLLGISLGTVATIGLLLLCPLGHFFLMRWMGHGPGHSRTTSGRTQLESDGDAER
jgi:hypothetical protein